MGGGGLPPRRSSFFFYSRNMEIFRKYYLLNLVVIGIDCLLLSSQLFFFSSSLYVRDWHRHSSIVVVPGHPWSMEDQGAKLRCQNRHLVLVVWFQDLTDYVIPIQ